MTKAAINALAYLYLTGSMPKYIRHDTWSAVYRCSDRARGEDERTVKEDCMHYIENHPMIAGVERLKAEGWAVLKPQRGKISAGVKLTKYHGRETLTSSLRTDGVQGPVFSV